MSSDVKYSVKQHAGLIKRGIKIYSTFPKPVMMSSALASVIEALVPFVNLYFSAMILNELTGAQNRERLILLVALTVGLNLLVLLVQKALARWKDYCGAYNWNQFYKVYTDKALSMDFSNVEDPDVKHEYSQIRQHQNGMGFGLAQLSGPIPGMIKGLIQIAMSVTLAFTLFTYKVPEDSSYTWLDSWWMIVIFIVVLAGPVLLTPYLNMTGGKIWSVATHFNNKANRFFFFYLYNMIKDSDAAKDIRIYDQSKMIRKNTDPGNDLFNISQWNKFAKYNGRFVAAGTAVAYLCNGLIYLFIALKALSGAFGVGNIVLYVGAVTQFGMGFSSMLSQIANLLNNNPFLDKVLQFLDTKNPMYQGSLTTEKRSDHKYEIEFCNVRVKYASCGE